MLALSPEDVSTVLFAFSLKAEPGRAAGTAVEILLLFVGAYRLIVSAPQNDATV